MKIHQKIGWVSVALCLSSAAFAEGPVDTQDSMLSKAASYAKQYVVKTHTEKLANEAAKLASQKFSQMIYGTDMRVVLPNGKEVDVLKNIPI